MTYIVLIKATVHDTKFFTSSIFFDCHNVFILNNCNFNHKFVKTKIP